MRHHLLKVRHVCLGGFQVVWARPIKTDPYDRRRISKVVFSIEMKQLFPYDSSSHWNVAFSRPAKAYIGRSSGIIAQGTPPKRTGQKTTDAVVMSNITKSGCC